MTDVKHYHTFGWYRPVTATMLNKGAVVEDMQPRLVDNVFIMELNSYYGLYMIVLDIL